MIASILMLSILGVSFVSANWFTDLFTFGEEGDLSGTLGTLKPDSYIIDGDFGEIVFGSKEEGLTADMVDFASTFFGDPIDGSSARYFIQSPDYDNDMAIVITEFQNDINFKDFDEGLVSLFKAEGMQLDYDPVGDLAYGIEDAQILFTGNYDSNSRSESHSIWISKNKLVFIYIEDLRAIEEGSSTMNDNYIDFLKAYLEQYPSTLVLPKCTDDDGHLSFKEQVYQYSKTYTLTDLQRDTCFDENTLVEYTCSGDLILKEDYICPGGCFDGACLILKVETPSYCGDGECDGLREFNFLNNLESIIINYHGVDYTISVFIDGPNAVRFTANDEISPMLKQDQLFEFENKLLIYVEDITYENYDGGVQSVGYIIGEDEMTCPQDCSIQIPEEIVFCEKTRGGDMCRWDIVSNCDPNFIITQDNWLVPACKPSCCVSDQGTCSQWVFPTYCEGNVYDDYKCDIPICGLGCCIIGENAIYGTSGECEALASTEGVITEFKQISELECISDFGGTINAYVAKGWNLMYGFIDPTMQIVDGSLGEENIKVIYALMPDNQEYARVYPEPEIDKLNRLDENQLINTGFWVYSNKEAEIKYKLVEKIIPFDQRQIYAGWNFVGITPEMIDPERREEIRHLIGDCAVEKLYVFDNYDQEWMEVSLYEELYDREIIGLTLVMRVVEDCYLGRAQETIVAPPALPWSGGTGGETLIHPQVIGSYELKDFDQEETGCETFEPGMEGLNLSGEYCAKMSRVEYLDGDSSNGVTLFLIKFIKGADLFKQYLDAFSEIAMRVNDNEIWRLERHELYWYSDTEYDIILTQEYDRWYEYTPDGISYWNYQYKEAIGANSVTQWFMNKYPPINIA